MADQGRWRADGEEEFAAELGYVIISASDGRSELAWEPKPPWVNRTGTVFGGIVAAMVDTVAGTAVGSSPILEAGSRRSGRLQAGSLL